jgi:hypothetical protein
MNSFQRVIKYCAIAFAVLLAIGIISFMVNVVYGVVTFASGRGFRTNDNDYKTINFDETFTGVTGLDIDNSTGTLGIEVGDTFRVEGRNVFEGFKAEVNNDGTLIVSDNESGFRFWGFHINGFNSPNSKITVYVPADFVAEEVRIETGAGAVNLEDFSTDYLYISAGAGNINGRNLVADKVKVEGGVGSINLGNVTFENTNFNCGVGNVYISGVLLEENSFDCGVGEVELELTGDINDYNLDIESGVGSIRVNGKKIEEMEETNRFADHSIEVDGGVGSVRIDIE